MGRKYLTLAGKRQEKAAGTKNDDVTEVTDDSASIISA
jgi:hypothetical protein